MSATAQRIAMRVPPHAYFVGSALFHALGPAFAVLLFARVPVGGVAWLRIVSAAVVFALWRRPWRTLHLWSRESAMAVLMLGAVLAVMNYSFYMAISRLPLGTVAAIEFLGPVVLAVAGTRTLRNLAALILTVAGIALLVKMRIEGDAVALAWAFVNCALFTAYIMLAHRVAQEASGISSIDRLAAAMLVAGVFVTPIGFGEALVAFRDPAVLAAGIVVGVSSSVVPTVFDQLAMARLPRATYALFIALLPATAVLIGLVVLGQIPSLRESAGVALVIAGVAIHRKREADARQAAGA